MSATTRCEHCHHAFPISLGRCPHCARPGLFPNVAMANMDTERKALQRRYERAMEDATRRGCQENVRAFEAQAATSKAVIARSYEETMRLASGDHNLYATYHQLAESDLRIPEGSQWDKLRSLTDETLFGPYKREIRFAALSLDGLGRMSYGDCSWVMRDEMIAHRASVFEENSVMFIDRHQIQLSAPEGVPAGFRATWEERAKLCVVKLTEGIDSETEAGDFAQILLRQGATPEEDDFVEVHIGGPMTARTLERVILKRGARRNAFGKALAAKLEKLGVSVEEKQWTQ